MPVRVEEYAARLRNSLTPWNSRRPAETPGMRESDTESGGFALIQRVYVAISPLPLLLFAALPAYTGELEGWGARASGPHPYSG